MGDRQIKQLRMPRDPWAPALRAARFSVKTGQAIAAKGGHKDTLMVPFGGHNVAWVSEATRGCLRRGYLCSEEEFGLSKKRVVFVCNWYRGFPIGNTPTGRERLGLSPKEQPPRSLSGKRTGWGATRRRETLVGPPKEQTRKWVNLSGTANGGGIW